MTFAEIFIDAQRAADAPAFASFVVICQICMKNSRSWDGGEKYSFTFPDESIIYFSARHQRFYLTAERLESDQGEITVKA